MRIFRMGAATLISSIVFIIFLIHLWATHNTDIAAGQAVQILLRDTRFRSTRLKEAEPRSYDEQIRNETLGVSGFGLYGKVWRRLLTMRFVAV